MKTRIIHFSAWAFVAVSAISILYVSLLAFLNPQQVMDLVQVKLPNNDAYSSIRGVYGGVGLTLVAVLIYFCRKNPVTALYFLGFFWSMYALSRIITIMAEGSLGSFGRQWLVIELVFAAAAFVFAGLRQGVRSGEARRYPATAVN